MGKSKAANIARMKAHKRARQHALLEQRLAGIPDPGIHLLDVGAGREVERARRVATELLQQGKPGKVVAIDLLANPEAHKDLPNLEVSNLDALQRIRTIAPGDVHRINFDLSLVDASAEAKARMHFPNPPCRACKHSADTRSGCRNEKGPAPAW